MKTREKRANRRKQPEQVEQPVGYGEAEGREPNQPIEEQEVGADRGDQWVDEVEEASRESFPASDAPSWSPSTVD